MASRVNEAFIVFFWIKWTEMGNGVKLMMLLVDYLDNEGISGGLYTARDQKSACFWNARVSTLQLV
jgi:hypothetical protein